MNTYHPQRDHIVTFLKVLREEIIQAFETFEETERFQRTSWDYSHQGGGEISLIRGQVFEKAAVNWSGVSGPRLPFSTVDTPFFATGVSLITHMMNPHAPTAHFNIRFIETADRYWFGGGYDLSPMGLSYSEDTHHFHETAKEALDPFGENLYFRMSQEAKEYFYIPHRKRERGVGGIFFDHWNTGHFDQDLAMWKAVGHSFLKAIMPIYKKRIHHSYLPEEKELQFKYRAQYAEFNLVYDRGTKFGFQSGGNPEAILCSMPPCAKW